MLVVKSVVIFLLACATADSVIDQVVALDKYGNVIKTLGHDDSIFKNAIQTENVAATGSSDTTAKSNKLESKYLKSLNEMNEAEATVISNLSPAGAGIGDYRRQYTVLAKAVVELVKSSQGKSSYDKNYLETVDKAVSEGYSNPGEVSAQVQKYFDFMRNTYLNEWSNLLLGLCGENKNKSKADEVCDVIINDFFKIIDNNGDKVTMYHYLRMRDVLFALKVAAEDVLQNNDEFIKISKDLNIVKYLVDNKENVTKLVKTISKVINAMHRLY